MVINVLVYCLENCMNISRINFHQKYTFYSKNIAHRSIGNFPAFFQHNLLQSLSVSGTLPGTLID